MKSLPSRIEDDLKYKWFVAPSIKRENYEAAVNRFNRAAELIGLGYSIRLKTKHEISDDSPIIQSAYALKEHPRSKKALDNLVSALSEDLSTEYEAVFVDRQTGTELRPSELGVGVSQMVPLLIAAQHAFSILSIQQPELHLHPAMQCDLADYLCFFLKRDGGERICLVETHSEHLILRLLRRIRETTNGQIPNENCYLQLTPDDLSVLYIDQASDGMRVNHLRVDENGQFIDEWPEGFFEEGFNEIVGGL